MLAVRRTTRPLAKPKRTSSKSRPVAILFHARSHASSPFLPALDAKAVATYARPGSGLKWRSLDGAHLIRLM